ncbi:unnamed protein product [Amoebophrya sp. A25]|nr:unnamed protein product [Amoebophrya sp. A25]|eukprot:GSA25T00020101001.1
MLSQVGSAIRESLFGRNKLRNSADGSIATHGGTGRSRNQTPEPGTTDVSAKNKRQSAAHNATSSTSYSNENDAVFRGLRAREREQHTRIASLQGKLAEKEAGSNELTSRLRKTTAELQMRDESLMQSHEDMSKLRLDIHELRRENSFLSEKVQNQEAEIQRLRSMLDLHHSGAGQSSTSAGSGTTAMQHGRNQIRGGNASSRELSGSRNTLPHSSHSGSKVNVLFSGDSTSNSGAPSGDEQLSVKGAAGVYSKHANPTGIGPQKTRNYGFAAPPRGTRSGPPDDQNGCNSTSNGATVIEDDDDCWDERIEDSPEPDDVENPEPITSGNGLSSGTTRSFGLRGGVLPSGQMPLGSYSSGGGGDRSRGASTLFNSGSTSSNPFLNVSSQQQMGGGARRMSSAERAQQAVARSWDSRNLSRSGSIASLRGGGPNAGSGSALPSPTDGAIPPSGTNQLLPASGNIGSTTSTSSSMSLSSPQYMSNVDTSLGIAPVIMSSTLLSTENIDMQHQVGVGGDHLQKEQQNSNNLELNDQSLNQDLLHNSRNPFLLSQENDELFGPGGPHTDRHVVTSGTSGTMGASMINNQHQQHVNVNLQVGSGSPDQDGMDLVSDWPSSDKNSSPLVIDPPQGATVGDNTTSSNTDLNFASANSSMNKMNTTSTSSPQYQQHHHLGGASGRVGSIREQFSTRSSSNKTSFKPFGGAISQQLQQQERRQSDSFHDVDSDAEMEESKNTLSSSGGAGAAHRGISPSAGGGAFNSSSYNREERQLDLGTGGIVGGETPSSGQLNGSGRRISNLKPPASLTSLTMTELKARLKEKGLSTAGRKDILVERLQRIKY